MREAIGGAMSLQVIMIFLIVVNCYLAFSVNYTKAFRVKNEILSIIEKNEGLTCDARDQISEYMRINKYTTNSGFQTWCTQNGYTVANTDTGSFCYKYSTVDVTGNNNANSRFKGVYYTVATFVNMDIPLVNNILPFAGNLFLIKGETALIYSSGVGNEGIENICQ